MKCYKLRHILECSVGLSVPIGDTSRSTNRVQLLDTASNGKKVQSTGLLPEVENLTHVNFFRSQWNKFNALNFMFNTATPELPPHAACSIVSQRQQHVESHRLRRRSKSSYLLKRSLVVLVLLKPFVMHVSFVLSCLHPSSQRRRGIAVSQCTPSRHYVNSDHKQSLRACRLRRTLSVPVHPCGTGFMSCRPATRQNTLNPLLSVVSEDGCIH